ncbi:MAG: hypothetical protein ACXVBZ_11345, partial [Flavisolibacter sp.]
MFTGFLFGESITEISIKITLGASSDAKNIASTNRLSQTKALSSKGIVSIKNMTIDGKGLYEWIE